jgi:hypothetical protein
MVTIKFTSGKEVVLPESDLLEFAKKLSDEAKKVFTAPMPKPPEPEKPKLYLYKRDFTIGPGMKIRMTLWAESKEKATAEFDKIQKENDRLFEATKEQEDLAFFIRELENRKNFKEKTFNDYGPKWTASVKDTNLFDFIDKLLG